jgi:type IV pilus biogenesis protein CpaD/CtpE
MPKSLVIYPALLLAALAALVSGCGGGDEAPTRAAYIKQAEAICKKVGSNEQKLQGEYIQKNYQQLKNEPPPPNNVKFVAYTVRTIRVPSTLKELEELEALEAPEGDEAKLKKIFAGTREGLQKLKEDPQVVWATRGGNPLYPSFRLARDYGFQFCAES